MSQAVEQGGGRPIVRWGDVSRVAEALAATAAGEPAAIVAPLVRVVDDLIAPHVLLTRLHDLTQPVLAGDRHAEAELRSRVCELARRRPEAAALIRRLIDRSVGESAGLCGRGVEPKIPADRRPDQPPEAEPDPSPGSLDTTAVFELAAAVARVFQAAPDEERADAQASIFGTVVAAGAMDRLLSALRERGPAGVAQEMSWLARLRTGPIQAPPPMMFLSGGIPGLPGGGIPGLPGGGIPGLPGGPVGPDGGPVGPDGGLPDLIRKRINDLVKGRKLWDPETTDHAPVRIFDPHFIDTSKIRCEIALAAALLKLNEPPPPRPARVVWSDNITAIEAPDPCVGGQVLIRGLHFGAPKPAGVGLMVPINGVCTPLDVAPAAWTDTLI